MYLKRIELNGFKSFHNKKEIIVNDGITGVVGPNGSGKSNIADALRWVLGEQSSKNLRGSTMQDVIFNGTQSRPKKGYCEVSLVFDNADRRVDVEYTEICVRRKMYRSGESEYSINNAGCRLKDILELFRDTGIGKEGYSIIGQGRIDEILNSKATQRRRVFEEAAGIMKYRVRKEEAERNLQKTSNNIVRLDDIIAELEGQIEPLEKQMNEAKDYFAMRESLKNLEINLFLYNYDRAAERMDKLQQQIGENGQEQEDLNLAAAKLNGEQAETKRVLAEIQTDIEKHNSRVSAMMQEQEKLKGEYALAEEKENQHKTLLGQSGLKSAELEDKIAAHAQALEEINMRIQQINGILDEKYAEILQLKETMQGVVGETDMAAGEIGGMKRAAEEKRVLLQTTKIEQNESLLKTEMLKKSCAVAAEQMDAHLEYTQKLAQEAHVYEDGVAVCEEESARLRGRSNEISGALVKLTGEAAEQNEAMKEVSRLLSEDRSRYKMISDMRDDYEGYFDSVKSLFRHTKSAPHIRQKIRGVLAEVIDVPQKYELPMEVILGNALQNVVVDSDGDAKEIIDYLRKNNLGRITFLPANSLKVRRLREEERKFLREEGVLCVASEAITCADDIRPAVDFLLGRTVIVRDMDCAIALMRKTDYAFRTVTMQGDFIKPGGVITGGSVKNTNTGLLARKRLAEELAAAIQKNTVRAEGIVKILDKNSMEIKYMQEEQMKLLAALREQEIKTAETRQKLISVRRQLEEKDSISAEMKQQADESGLELQKVKRRVEEEAEAVWQLQEEYDALVEKLTAAEDTMAEGLKKSTAFRDELSALELKQTEINNQKNMLLSEAEHVRVAVSTAREETEAIARQNAAAEAELRVVKEIKREIREKLDDVLVGVKNAGAVAQELFDGRDKLSAQMEQNERQMEQQAQNKNLLIEQKYRLIANKEKAEISRETMQTKLWEDYGLTYANALAHRTEDFAYQNSVKEIDAIRETVREMGAVNPNAIEDYARVRERYDNLVLQREDLAAAGEDLRVVIGDLLAGMRDSFGRKFAQINANFTRVFQELFGGGNAQLELLDEGDIMECGVEIIAEPPGKKLQSISLLSGGEKALTAIALLFAMLSINPSPVCLLDEIDAPLDDANVIRLADYLTRLSKELQFIVITHRKPTMAICDTLYGIAMHEKGVSDIVSVKLN